MKRLLKARFPTITAPDPFVVTIDGKETKFLEMVIVILGMKTDRAYYSGPYTPGSTPVCSSEDGMTGIQIVSKETGEFTKHDCEFCSFRTQQFRPCRQYGRAFVMDLKSGRFFIFQIPPKSLSNLGAIEFEFEIKGLPKDQPIQCTISSSAKLVNFTDATVYNGEKLPFKFVGIEGRDTVVMELYSNESLLLSSSIPDAIPDETNTANATEVV